MKFRKGKPEEVGMSAKRINHVSDLARGWVEDGTIPSLVVLAARRGTIVLHEAFGVQSPDSNSPKLKTDTLFPLASISKVITATAAIILVEDGLLSLNRPVQDYIPEFVGEKKEQVMVHHLLTHTSGLEAEKLGKQMEKKKQSVDIPSPTDDIHPAISELLFLGLDAPLMKNPGEEMLYCSFNFDILGEIIRRVNGNSLVDFVQERIFDPLGMKNSYYILPDSLEDNVVRRPSDAPFAEFFETMKEIPRASSGVFSSALDIATFGQMYLNGGVYNGYRLLSPASVSEMTRNQIPGIPYTYFWEFKNGETFPEAGWGLGWNIEENKKIVRFGSLWSQSTFSHSGAGGVNMWVDPVNEIIGVYLSVELESREDGGHKWNLDLFVNAITAAVVD